MIIILDKAHVLRAVARAPVARLEWEGVEGDALLAAVCARTLGS